MILKTVSTTFKLFLLTRLEAEGGIFLCISFAIGKIILEKKAGHNVSGIHYGVNKYLFSHNSKEWKIQDQSCSKICFLV